MMYIISTAQQDSNFVSQYSMDYQLHESAIEKSPFLQFRKWYSYATMQNVQDVAAMTVCTVNDEGCPSSRVVYMRDMDDDGFVFYTNYKSRKAFEMNSNPNVCANFFWQPLGRQVRIEGTVQKISPQDSDDYFSLRPRDSRIGAWASPQSHVLTSRKELDERFQTLKDAFENREVSRPEWWGGYKIIPKYFEFWLGRDSRLHDRICYRKLTDSSWKIERLAP